jgi:hypothetical protein
MKVKTKLGLCKKEDKMTSEERRYRMRVGMKSIQGDSRPSTVDPVTENRGPIGWKKKHKDISVDEGST